MLGGGSLPRGPRAAPIWGAAGFPAVIEFSFDGSAVARAMRLRVEGDKGEPATRFEPVSVSAEELRPYEGSYSSAELGVTWPIAFENGKLVIRSQKRSLLDVAGGPPPARKDTVGATGWGGFFQFTP